MAIRAVAFDIGGILELTPDTGWRSRWESLLGLAPGELDRRLEAVWRAGSVGAITEAEYERRVEELLGLEAAQRAAFVEEGWRDYLGAPNVELIAYFASLRSRVRTGIISNSFVGAREREQARYGFGSLCDLLIYSHEVGLEKPDPRIFGLACERLGVLPEEMVFLDDVAGHVDAARSLGIRAVHYRDNAQAIAAIEAFLDR